VEALKGELDGIPFHIMCMKEEDYVMMLMSTYGTLTRVGDDKIRTIDNQRLTFKYPEVIHNHYQYRDAVDSHNARRMAPIAMEETWNTGRWPIRVFTYLLSTSEVNANLGESQFGAAEETRPQLEFRRLLARDLINNAYLTMEQQGESPGRKSKRIRESHGHELVHIPRGKKFQGARLVKSKSNYAFNFCSCHAKRVRTYCKCTPGLLLCTVCFATHCQEIDTVL
jgi:hypothetical protein